MKIVATTSLPAVDRPNADRWNAARSRQFIISMLCRNFKHIFVKISSVIFREDKNDCLLTLYCATLVDFDIEYPR